MRKQLIALALAFALAALVIACGSSTGTNEYVEPAMEGTTFTAASELSSETESQETESESAAQTEAAASFSAGTITQALVTSTTQATTTTTAKQITTATTTARTTTTTRATTTTTRATTTTTAAPQPQTQAPKPTYGEADYAEIIAAVRKYAENEMSLPFVWDTKLTYEYAQSGRAGFHDVVNLTLYGKAFVISELKYHCELTDDLASGAHGGVPSTEVHYNIVHFDYQNHRMFILVYG